MSDILGRGQHLMRLGDGAQTGGKVNGSSDVVIAVDQDDWPSRHPGPKRKRGSRFGDLFFDLDNGMKERFWLNAYQHRPITEPFGDPHPTSGGHTADRQPECRQGRYRPIITLAVGVGREPGKIKEGKRPKDPGCPVGRPLNAGQIGHAPTLANLARQLLFGTYSCPMSALEMIARWPGLAAAATTGPDGSTTWFGPADRPFALASLTKLLTALAVLIAHEDDTLNLDEPVTPAGATVADLLAHSSGLAPDQPTQLTQPQRRRIYSTAAYDLLGELIAQRSGISFPTYLREAVLQPLDLTTTRLDGSPGAGGHGSVTDMVRLADAWTHPRLIDPSTLARATRPHLPELGGVLPGFGRHDPNPWGLGPEIRGTKQPHWTSPENSTETFGHFGQSGTMLWIDPVAGVTLVALSNEPFGPWATHAWPELATAVLRATGDQNGEARSQG